MAYDILIKSGTVIDGTGNPPTTADVAVEGESVAAVGDLGNAGAKRSIDASGKYVTPGFIDITNHSDTHLTLFKYPALESLLMQGVTTVIGGNCGASLAPLASRDAIQAIRKWADPAEINVNWTSVAELLGELERFRLGVNFGTLIGYGTLRRGIIGNEVKLLSPEEREKVRLLLRDGLQQGAYGLSLGLSYGHERIANTDEIIAIAQVVAGTGGILKVHLRSEGKELLAAINEVIRIGRETEVPIVVSHFKAIGKKAWPLARKALDLIASAAASGVNIAFDVSPYRTTGSPLYLLIPAGARVGGFQELFKRLGSAEERAKIIEALRALTLHYDRILVTSAKTPTVVGKTLAEIATTAGLGPEEALLDTVRANEGRVSIVGRTLSRKNTQRAISDPNSLIASDGAGFSQDAAKSGNLVHPRSFGAFPHFLHTVVEDAKILTMEEAIAKITSRPAAKLGLEKRGSIAKGNFADIAIFDPRLFRDRATYTNPFRYPAGIEWVMVNGNVVVENGRHNGQRAGRILRKA